MADPGSLSARVSLGTCDEFGTLNSKLFWTSKQLFGIANDIFILGNLVSSNTVLPLALKTKHSLASEFLLTTMINLKVKMYLICGSLHILFNKQYYA